MRLAFLTEMGFEGKVPIGYTNMRTEFAWMYALNVDHYNIYSISSVSKVKDYDKVFVIFPKGEIYLNAVGSRLVEGKNSASDILDRDLISTLRSQNNQKIYYVQEGPHWLWNDYEIQDQVRFYNFISSCDGVYAHNQSDTHYYKGMFPHLEIDIIPTLMVDSLLTDVNAEPEDKVIIGGNFARWYGGFESYIVAGEFNLPIWVQTSHATRDRENEIENLQHLPRMFWLEWMQELRKFKYAVHLMPTVAAGTFSLNCAYFGIPTIGNIEVDTQRICHPNLSVDVHDVNTARKLAKLLRHDTDFYQDQHKLCKQKYEEHFSINKFLKKIKH